MKPFALFSTFQSHIRMVRLMEHMVCSPTLTRPGPDDKNGNRKGGGTDGGGGVLSDRKDALESEYFYRKNKQLMDKIKEKCVKGKDGKCKSNGEEDKDSGK